MKALLILLVLFSFSYAQYDAEVSSYNIYWNKLDAGQTPPPASTIIHSDTVITFLWERGGVGIPAYVSPYTSTVETAMVIVNSPTLWTDATAAISRDVILPNGEYEVIVTESDIYGNEGEYGGDPMFMDVVKSVAQVQINLRVR